jgi:hypothetical protein
VRYFPKTLVRSYDAFPLPDLGSPFHNFTEAANEKPKKDLLAHMDDKLDKEVVLGKDKSQELSYTKIWYDIVSENTAAVF